MRRLLALAGMPRGRVALAVLLGTATVLFGVGLMTTSGYLISRAAQHPPVLELTVAIVGVRFFGVARPIARYLERLASHDLALRSLVRVARGRVRADRAAGAGRPRGVPPRRPGAPDGGRHRRPPGAVRACRRAGAGRRRGVRRLRRHRRHHAAGGWGDSGRRAARRRRRRARTGRLGGPQRRCPAGAGPRRAERRAGRAAARRARAGRVRRRRPGDRRGARPRPRAGPARPPRRLGGRRRGGAVGRGDRRDRGRRAGRRRVRARRRAARCRADRRAGAARAGRVRGRRAAPRLPPASWPRCALPARGCSI